MGKPLLVVVPAPRIALWGICGGLPEQLAAEVAYRCSHDFRAGLAYALKFGDAIRIFGSYGLIEPTAPVTAAFHADPPATLAQLRLQVKEQGLHRFDIDAVDSRNYLALLRRAVPAGVLVRGRGVGPGPGAAAWLEGEVAGRGGPPKSRILLPLMAPARIAL